MGDWVAIGMAFLIVGTIWLFVEMGE